MRQDAGQKLLVQVGLWQVEQAFINMVMIHVAGMRPGPGLRCGIGSEVGIAEADTLHGFSKIVKETGDAPLSDCRPSDRCNS